MVIYTLEQLDWRSSNLQNSFSFQLYLFTMMSELMGTSIDEFHLIQNKELMSVTVSYKNTGSLLKCSSLCSSMTRPSCLSLSYDRNTKTCHLSDNSTQPRTDESSAAPVFGRQMHLDNGMSYIMLLLLLRILFLQLGI